MHLGKHNLPKTKEKTIDGKDGPEHEDEFEI